MSLSELYRYCEIAREMLKGELGVGRVIARPFGGVHPFVRLPGRHDYSLEPHGETMLDRLKDKGFDALVEAEQGDFTIDNLPRGTVMIRWRQLLRGFELGTPKIAVLSMLDDGKDGSLTASGRLKTSRKKKSAAERILSYNDLSVGDYVVHEVHGIGQYMGIENLTVDGVSRDYITIKYAGSDRLFLPTDKLDMISKYIGAHSDDGLVKLSKFGGGEWGRAKAKAKAAVKEMAKELIKLYAERMRRPGFAFPEDDDLQRDFASSATPLCGRHQKMSCCPGWYRRYCGGPHCVPKPEADP